MPWCPVSSRCACEYMLLRYVTNDTTGSPEPITIRVPTQQKTKMYSRHVKKYILDNSWTRFFQLHRWWHLQSSCCGIWQSSVTQNDIQVVLLSLMTQGELPLTVYHIVRCRSTGRCIPHCIRCKALWVLFYREGKYTYFRICTIQKANHGAWSLVSPRAGTTCQQSIQPGTQSLAPAIRERYKGRLHR